MFSMRAVLLATATLTSIPAQAQNAPAAAEEDVGLADIIVTARKVSEKLQDVPLSIKALTGQELQERGITSISELAQFTPGLSYSPDFGRVGERPVIRGISALRTEAPQPVSIFINGVFVRDGALGLVLDDAERVEVIKGPQSALYGRSTYAGAINYITPKPGNDVKGHVTATLAGGGERSLSAAVTLPIIPDVLSTRIRGRHYAFTGQYTNAQTGNKIGSERTNSLGIDISFTPSSSFDALASLSMSDDDDGLFVATARTIPIQAGGIVTNQNGSTNIANGATCNGRTISIVGNNAVTGLPDPLVAASATTLANGWPCGASNFTGTTVNRNETGLSSYIDPATGINYGNIAGLRRNIIRGSLVMNFNFGDGYTLTSLSGYTRQRSNIGADQSYDGVPFTIPAVGGASWRTYDRDRLTYGSQELRLSSPQDRPFTWLIGGFYYQEDVSGVTSDVGILTTGLAAPIRPKSGSSVTNYAGYARVQYAFSDTLKVSAEGRYGSEKVSVVGTNLGITTVASGVCQTVGAQCVVVGSRTFNDFAPRFTLDFKPAPGILLYAQVAKGVKSGGFNSTPGLSAANFNYDGESVWSYEAGIKSDVFGKKVRFNLAVFQNDISGLQLSNLAGYQNPVTGSVTTTTIVNNVGKARTRGFEVELMAKPINWLTLSANYAYTDAKAIEGTEVTNGTVFGGNRSVAGAELPRSPKHSAAVSAAVDYPINADGLRFVLRGDLVYQSRRYAEIQNLIWANPYTHINASIGLKGKGWSGILFVKNATDDTTSLNGFRYVNSVNFRRSAVDFLPRLRQFGGTLSFDF